MKGSTNTRPFKLFQVRWTEKLGYEDCPYLIRWTFIIFGYSIRIHHWLRSDDNRFFHDHSADLLSIVLKGWYWNVKPFVPNLSPNDEVEPHVVSTEISGVKASGLTTKNVNPFYVEGIFNSWHNFFHMGKSIWFSRAEDQHYLKIPKGGAWTLMFEGRPRIKWGFFVNGHKWRPLRYFHKYGIRQTADYQ